MNRRTLYLPLFTLALSSLAAAQNDECNTAIAVGLGTAFFDTTTATQSSPVWPCAGGGGPDLWYSYVSQGDGEIRITTCGPYFDTALEVFGGSCASLISLSCNDDACGLQSQVTVPAPTPGTTYYFRVGGFAGNTGPGTFTVEQAVDSPASLIAHYTLDDSGATAVDVGPIGIPGTYMGGSQGAPGAAAGTRTSVDFQAPSHIVIPGHPALDQLVNDLSAAAWIRPDVLPLGISRIFGNEAPGGSWSFGVSNFGDLRFTTHGVQDYDIAASIPTQQWTHVALAMDASNDVHFYVNGAPIGSVAGSAPAAAPSANYLIGSFGPTATFPEYFDGRIDDVQIYDGVLTPAEVVQLYTNPATNLGAQNPVCCGYCGGNPNSTGQVARILADGTSTLSANNYQLIVDSMPMNSFGYFLCSTTSGFVMNPAGSQGILCLGGDIGRYVGPGEIRNSGATGAIALRVDFTRLPQPTGFVSAMPGETWQFQAWYRDSVGGVATSNFSDGRRVSLN